MTTVPTVCYLFVLTTPSFCVFVAHKFLGDRSTGTFNMSCCYSFLIYHFPPSGYSGVTTWTSQLSRDPPPSRVLASDPSHHAWLWCDTPNTFLLIMLKLSFINLTIMAFVWIFKLISWVCGAWVYKLRSFIKCGRFSAPSTHILVPVSSLWVHRRHLVHLMRPSGHFLFLRLANFTTRTWRFLILASSLLKLPLKCSSDFSF